MTTPRLFPFALLLPLVLGSCGGETFREVAARNQAGLDGLRADFKKLGELVAANPPAKELAAPLDPAPSFKDDDKEGSNTVLLAWELLADPVKEIPDEDYTNLYYSHGVENIFSWAEGEEKAFEDFEAELKGVAALRYLVAYKRLEYKEPAVDGELSYTIGGAALAVHLFDRAKQEIVCSFPVAAMSDAEVSYQYKEGENRQAAAQSWAHSNLWENLREEILKGLAEKTGGVFAD